MKIHPRLLGYFIFSIIHFPGQSQETDYFIAPEGKSLKFFSCIDGILKREIIPGTSTLAKNDINFSKAAILDTQGNRIQLFDFNNSISTPIQTIYKKENHSNWESLKFINDSILAIGHSADSAKLSLVNLNTGKHTEYSGPDSIFFWKGIDEILIEGNTLWAVDDLIMPLYILEYEIINGDNLKLKNIHSLNSNGSYESISMAILTNEYIAYLSHTGGGYGTYYPYFITFLKKSSPEFSITYVGGGYNQRFKVKNSKEKYKDKFPFRISSITANNEFLYFSKPEVGLGAIRLENIVTHKSNDFNMKLPSNEVTETPMKNLFRVIWIKNNSLLIGVFKESDNYSVRIIPN